MAEVTTEQVIIEFIADDTDLKATTVSVAKVIGKTEKETSQLLQKTNAELAKKNQLLGAQVTQQDRAAKGSKQFVATLGDLDKKTKSLVQNFVQGFLEQAQVEMKSLREEVERLNKGQTKTKDGAVSLRQELKNLTLQMANLKLEGKEATEQYRAFQIRAGEIKDTIADVNAEIKTTGSDTKVFDGLISAAQGLAGGFAVAQGAVALFGDESEEIQQTLLKVNSAMAILQGLQQIQNTLQKESAASLLFLNNTQKTNAAVTALAAGAESKNIIVKTASAAASKALSTAMALSNPITLAVVAVITAATAAYKFFTAEAKRSAEAQDLLNLKLKASLDLADDLDEGTRQFNERRIVDLRSTGATELQIREAQIKGLYDLRLDASKREIAIEQDAEIAREKLRTETDAKQVERLQKTVELFDQYQKRRTDLDQQIYILEKENIIAIAKEEEQAIKDREEKRKAYNAQREADERERLEQLLAGLQAERIGLDQNSQKYFQLSKAIIDVTAELKRLGEEGNKVLLVNAEAAQEYRDLLNTRVVAVARSEGLISDTVESSTEKQIDAFAAISKARQTFIKTDENALKLSLDEQVKLIQAYIQKFLEIYDLIGGGIMDINAERTKQEEIALENKRAAVDEELRLGQITEKEAQFRNARLDQEAKRLARAQAIRDKNNAIFSAVVNTAQGVTKALGALPPPASFALAALVGALGLLQINTIRQRPLPNLFRGKKHGNFEGFANVSEHGAEIIERKDRMYIEPKRTVAWIGRNDKVYTASETKDMIRRGMVINNPHNLSRGSHSERFSGYSMDFNQLGKVIAGNMPKVGLNIDESGFKAWVQNGLSRTEYLDKKTRL